MSMSIVEYSYGPVPSRRLGKSIGINNIPPKVCSYSCVYCQVGRTFRTSTDRQVFYAPEKIYQHIQNRLNTIKRIDEKIDYLTFVPDGEPTLDLNLGREIEWIKKLKIPVGVITNSSLLERDDVKEDLAKADWVSLKLDAVQQPLWMRLNRPCKELHLSNILDGMQEFARSFSGTLVTETMLVQGLNDDPRHIRELSDFLYHLQPDTAYLSIPTRPPAEKWVKGSNETVLNQAFHILAEKVPRVEYLVGYEGNAFACTSDIERDILSISAVHPLREEAIAEILARMDVSWELIDRLILQGDLVMREYEQHRFFLRNFTKSLKTGTEYA
jgi:wyosine [tRNA(Phe)-imidazoG37] synthetase (radical SAM superfamily)